MSCKYNNCKICGYKTECEIYKENTELTKACDETQELLDKQIEATYKLDKENAELKKQQFSLRNERNTFLAQNEQYEQDLIDFNDKLTKAKEHIENLLYYVKQCTCERSNYTEIEEDVKQAEQFLNSEVDK